MVQHGSAGSPAALTAGRTARPEPSADAGWLAEALPKLSETDRDVLTLTAWEGLSHAEAAQVLGCSATAVAVRLHRARGRLEALRPAAAATPRLEGATHDA